MHAASQWALSLLTCALTACGPQLIPQRSGGPTATPPPTAIDVSTGPATEMPAVVVLEVTPPDGIQATPEAPAAPVTRDGTTTFEVTLADGRQHVLAEEGGAAQMLAWDARFVAWRYACAVCAVPLETGVRVFDRETEADRLVLADVHPALGQAVIADGQLLVASRTFATGAYAGTLYAVDLDDPQSTAVPIADDVFVVPGSSQPLFAAGGGQTAWAELGSSFADVRWVLFDRERGTRVESPTLALDNPAGVAVSDGWLAWREPKGWRVFERQSGSVTAIAFTTVELESAQIGTIGPATFVDGRLVWSAQVDGETRWFASQLGAR